jgi:hypothetical protein
MMVLTGHPAGAINANTMKKLLYLLTVAFGVSLFASQAEADTLHTTTLSSGQKTTVLHGAKKNRKRHHSHKRRKHHRTTHHVSFASSNGVHWQK